MAEHAQILPGTLDLLILKAVFADYARGSWDAVIANGACWQRSLVQHAWRSMRRFPCSHQHRLREHAALWEE